MTVQQDKNYVSKVDPAIVDAFLKTFGKPPVANQAALKESQSRRPAGNTGAPLQTTMSQDMPLAPTTYGFADKAATAAWFEKAQDTPV